MSDVPSRGIREHRVNKVSAGAWNIQERENSYNYRDHTAPWTVRRPMRDYDRTPKGRSISFQRQSARGGDPA